MEINVQGARWPQVSARGIRRAAEAALVLESAPAECEISVRFCGDSEMAALNARYRNVPEPTDVLAFPLNETGEGGGADSLLGDVVVNLDAAREQAKEGGVPLQRELNELVVHGVLHLVGYRDDSPAEARQMAARQKEIGAAAGYLRAERAVYRPFPHAVRGVVQAFGAERHMRLHFLIIVLLIAVGLAVRLRPLEFVALAFACALVLIAEMFNSAIEAWIDEYSPGFNRRIKIIKDICAGAVLVAAANAVVIGALVFSGNPNVKRIFYQALILRRPLADFQIALAGAVVLVLLLLAIKQRGQHGSLLHGGVISGHSALAWFLAGVIFALAGQATLQLAAVGLALLVSQSRVEAKVHSLREVALGAAVGVALAVVVFAVGQ